MAKFRGPIGYAESTEIAPDVWEDVITERTHSGDVLRNSRALREGEKVNNDLSVSNSISIVADAYAREHFFAIRYVKWAGTYWIVSNAEKDPDRPRLTLRLGGVYNGPKNSSGSGSDPEGSPTGE